ncbi:Lin1244/Lin1753 domain-containing protein [Dellaglioa sp. BT-FLS60]
MARPAKLGLDYFPFDVDTFEDERIEAISGEFGLKGELTVIKLLCAIYKNGYFVVWNDLFKMKLSKRLPGVSPELLEAIVQRLITWEFFNEDLYNSSGVLSSLDIQETYLEATKRRQNMPKMDYCIHDVNINYPTTGVNVDINTQTKLNKTKLNKTKLNETTTAEVKVDSLRKVMDFYEQSGFGTLAPFTIEKITKWIEDFKEVGSSEPETLIIKALKIAVDKNARNWSYVEAILRDWEKKKLLTVKDVETSQRSYQSKPRVIPKETLPDWAKDDYVPPEVTTTVDKVALQKQLDEFNKTAEEARK